jgi:mannose-6-phosphate isomerase-like protein (cupin superfamily)
VKIVVFSYDAEILTPLLSGTMNAAPPLMGHPRGGSITIHKTPACAKNLSFTLKLVHTRAATFRQQNRKTHQQWMYMLNRTFYERPTKGQKFFGTVKTARIDPAVGIRLVKVTGDDHMGLYVAELEPHRSVTAHYHLAGSEIYQIVHGEGKIHTGVPTTDDVVAWHTSVDVRSGDCFTVQEGEVHQLENAGSYSMIAIIICPAAHIGHDRFIIKGEILS